MGSYLILELEVGGGPLLGYQQQVVEEEKVPLLALHTLQIECWFKTVIQNQIVTLKMFIFSCINRRDFPNTHRKKACYLKNGSSDNILHL